MARDLEWYEVQLRRISEHREADAEKEIRKLYKLLLSDLKSDLGKLYADNADDDGVIDFAHLRTNGRYAKFLELVEKRVNGVSPKVRKEITTIVQDTYKEAYEGLIDAVKHSKNIDELTIALDSVRAVTPETIKRAIQNPISGLTLNDTLEKNRQNVIYDIKQVMNIGLVNNDHVSTVARQLTEKVDMDYRKATRIVRTETHRVQEAGNSDAAQEINDVLERSPHTNMIMAKIWHNMGDERVRPQRPAYKHKKGMKASKKHTSGLRVSLSGANHVKMEGQTVKANEKFNLGTYKGQKVEADAPGCSGVAAHDINCRCFVEYDLMTPDEFIKATGRIGFNEKELTPKNYSDIVTMVKFDDANMRRKSNKNKIQPMPKKQLYRIVKSFKRQGGSIQYSKEIDVYLNSKNAEGITYNAKTILLKMNPGRASVFEELIHTNQYKTGENDGSYLSRLKCEIAAQEKLLKYSKAYKLTDVEIRQTQNALKEYKKELKAYDKKGGEQNV